MHTEYTHTVSIRCTHSNVPHDWPCLQGREAAPHVEKIRGKKSGGHRMMSAKQTLINVSMWSIWGWRAGERKDVLCNCPLSLSHSFTQIKSTHTLFFSEHENTKLSFEQQQQQQKMASCFIRLGKQQKKKKETLCRLVYYWHRPSIAHLSRSHSYTFTKIFTSRSNPHLFDFFCCFCHYFF